jgi:Arm DNA-binding domain
LGRLDDPRDGSANRTINFGKRLKMSKTISTDKQIKNLRTNGSYRVIGRPTKGLYLKVRNRGYNWFKRYRFHGKRREIYFGSYPTVGLADAVAAAMAADRQRFNGHDPLELRAEQKRERRRTTEKNKTFKAMADDLICQRSEHEPRPWKQSTKDDAERIVNGPLAPLHKFLCSEITPRQIFDIVNPMRIDTPSMADAVLKRARTIFDWADANSAMNPGQPNPAELRPGSELCKLFGTDDIEPEHEPRRALDWRKVPALMTTLNELSKPRTRYNVIEAATAIGVSVTEIYNNVGRNNIKAHRPDTALGCGLNKIEIEPDDLFRFKKAKVDVTPGLPPIAILFLKFLIQNGLRCDEVRYMRRSEWQREENLLVIPWQRMKGRNKAGAKQIKIDHVIPLNYRSVEILELLEEQQKRDNNESEFMFGNYRRANGNERMGKPISVEIVRRLLKRLLPPEEINAVLHGMRTSFRSWANIQRRMGYLKVTENDLERAIAHVEGYGKTPLQRLYSRDDDEIRPLIPVFDDWADFANTTGDVIPFHQPMKKVKGA